MKKQAKKGFTIVELVIVIALIAILAAVLIPTFSNVINNAHESSDTMMVKNLNTILNAEEANDNRAETMQEAVDQAEEGGYKVDKLTPTSTGDIVWDQESNRFLLINAKKEVVYKDESATGDVDLTNGAYKLWKITRDATKEDKGYSLYLANGAVAPAGAVEVGVDAGVNENVAVNFKSDAARDVIIRTNGGTLNVDAANATVRHFGEVEKVVITAVAGNSYHEHGKVVGNIEIAKGRVVMETGSTASAIKVTATAENVTNGTATIAVDTKTSAVTVVVPAEVKAAIEAKGGDSNKITAAEDKVVTDTTVIENMDKFAGGLGTAESPYLIATAEQFVKIGEFATRMAAEEIHFALLNDIDLSAVTTGEISTLFHGSLDGRGYSIKTGNSLKYLFNYVTGVTTFKDVTVSLGETLTKFTFGPTAQDVGDLVKLTYDNVDVKGKAGYKYNMGGNNAAYYATSTFCAASKFSIGETGDVSIGTTGEILWLENLYVNIIDCDVNANFTMSGDRAAVFCGGQVYTMNIKIEDCTYAGMFYGANPGLVFANAAYCEGESLVGSIELKNVQLLGSLVCLNKDAAHGLTFANNKNEISGTVNNGNIIECAVDSAMKIEANENNEYVITSASDKNVDSYTVQISLGKLYWYDLAGNITENESSNHMISVEISNADIGNTALYKCATMSLKQATENGISTEKIEWKTATEGVNFAFVDYNSEKLLVVDIDGAFADTTKVNAVHIIGNVNGTPTYYKK